MSDPIAGQFGTEPATNRTPSGRALNRSVRLVIERIGKPPRQPNPQFGCQFDDPCECPSDEWELIGVGGFEFVIGLGIFVAHFVLRNVKQRCCYSLNFQSFQASGVGAGISLDDFVFGSPTRFTTAPTVSIANFRDTRATVETIGAGFGVGFEEATIDFTQIRTTAEKIDIGGFTLGKFEVGGSAINAPGSVTLFNARRCG